jgi:RNA polymerase sigma factor (sigma-70 family)
MTAGQGTVRIEELLGQAEWLGRLASRLVQDRAGREDAIQETWVAALRSPPEAGRPSRPWLASVLRNAIRRRFRDASSRRAREAASEQPSAEVPGPEDLVARAETQRILADRVIGLEEPYRQVVLLRYYEGLGSAEIARALGIPAGTVRWRLHEGLRRLRSQLDARYGGRRAWTIILAPLAGKAGARAPSLGGLIMVTKLKIGIAVGVVTLLAVLTLVPRWDTAARRSAPARVSRAGATGGTGHGRRVIAAWKHAGGGQGRVTGLVIDGADRPVAGAMVAMVVASSFDDIADPDAFRPAQTTRSDAGGHFELAGVPPGLYLLTATAGRRGAGKVTGVSLLPRESLSGVTIRVDAGSTLVSGRVLDAAGGPIGTAEVRALALAAGGRPESSLTFVTRTKSDGTYALRMPRGSFRLAADADGYAPEVTTVFLDRDQSHSFRLSPAARVAGEVVEAGGAGVKGALVSLVAEGVFASTTRTAVTDPRGAFAFGNVPAGSYRLSARKGGRTGRAERSLIVASADAVEGVVVRLAAGRFVSGTVRNTEGQPVPGAVVQTGRRPSTATSGSDGTYRLTGLGPGPLTLVASAPGHGPARATVSVPAPGREGVDLTLSVGAQVTGRVTTEAGRPLAGASVTVLVFEPHALEDRVTSSGVARSDAAGRFSVDGLGAGQVRVEAEHPVEGRGLAEGPRLGEGRTLQLDVRIGAGAAVSGRVTWDDGASAAGVFVEGRRGSRAVRVTTDARGRYSIGPFSAGEVRVEAFPERDALGPVPGPQRRKIRLSAGERRKNVDLSLGRRDRALRGVTLGPDGSPIAGARIGVTPTINGTGYRPWNKYASAVDGGSYHVLSGGDGTFLLENLPRAKLALWATHPDYPETDLLLAAEGEGPVALRFRAGASLAGAVVEPDGRPVPAYTLYAALSADVDGSPELRAARGYVQAITSVHSGAGAFEIEHLQAASYDLLALAPDGRGGRLRGLTLAAGQRRSGLRIVVGDAVSLKGQVVDGASGAPLGGVQVIGWLALLLRRVEATTDAAGNFVLHGVVPAGSVMLSVRGDGRSHGARHQTVAVPGGASRVDLGRIALPPAKAGRRHGG